MADNPISGHTAGANDGLRDGDHILSPSLTNIYEGLHGNGVLNAHDTAFGSSDRNTPASLPGAVSSSVAHQVVVKACSVILDGVPYTIDNGSGGDVTLNLTSTGNNLTNTTTVALTSGQECLFVIVATSQGAKFIQTTPVTTAAGAYSDISGSIADSYLKMTNNGPSNNRQTVVLATIRATFNGSAAVANDLKLTLSEINDKRVFVRPSPFYLSPVTTGAVGSTDHLNTHTALEDIHGTGEEGDFGSNGVLWLSYNEDDNLPNLYFSAKDGSNRHTHLLGPNRIKTITASSGTVTFDFDEAQVFECNAGGAINLNPAASGFPPGHTVIVSVPSGSAVTFDSGGLGAALTAGDAALFVYNGTAWKRIMVSATTTSNASGAVGLIQFSDGAGNHNSDAKLFWTAGSSTLTVNGKLTVTGLIDPTGLELTPVGANPGGTAANTLWMDTGASNALKHGANTVLNSASSVEDLSDVTAVGSGSIISTAERTKLTGIATSADVTDATNVNAAIAGHTYTAATVAANDKVLIQDTDDSNNIKTVTATSIAALGGGGGGGTNIADADSDTKIDVEASSDEDKIRFDTAGSERMIIDENGKVGIGTSSPDVDLDVKKSATTIARVASTGSHANLRFGRASSSYDAAMLFYDDMASTPSLQWRIQMTSGGTDLSIRDEDGSPDGQEIMKFKDGGGIDINCDVAVASGHSITVGGTAVALTSALGAYQLAGASESEPFTPIGSGGGGTWAGSPPATIQEAIDRLAIQLAALGGPIP